MISKMHMPVILAVLVLAISPASDAKPRGAKTIVKGAVMLDLEANAAGATRIIFRRGRSVTTVTTARNGTYEAELRPGLYQVSTEAHGFCPVRRSEFELAPSAQVELNLVVIGCGIADYIQYDEKGNYKGEFSTHWPPHDYDSFPVQRGKTMQHLVVLFAARNAQGTEIRYVKSPPEVKARRPVRVMITYGLITIMADEARLSTRTMELCALGNLIVQDGAHTTRPPAVALRLVGGKGVLEEKSACSAGNEQIHAK